MAQTIATEQSVSITFGRLMFTTRIAAASTPTTTDGTIGAFDHACTCASEWANGRLLSRAMANMSRTDPAWTARRTDEHGEDHLDQQEDPQLGPEHVLDQKRQAAADLAQLGVRWIADREDAEEHEERAGQAGGGECLEDRPGRAAARSVGLLGQGARRVEAVQDVRGHERRRQEWAQVAPGAAFATTLRIKQDRRTAANVRRE